MSEIRTPQELSSELHRIMAMCQGPTRPERRVLASELRELATKLAAQPSLYADFMGGRGLRVWVSVEIEDKAAPVIKNLQHTFAMLGAVQRLLQSRKSLRLGFDDIEIEIKGRQAILSLLVKTGNLNDDQEGAIAQALGTLVEDERSYPA